MNNLSIFTLKVLRKLYTKTFGDSQLPPLQREENPDKISDIIYKLLMDEKPCMIARFGAFELSTIINYIGVKQGRQPFFKYIKGEVPKWWWDEQLIKFMNTNAGFFPPTQEKIKQFCELMLEDTKEVDLLGSWLREEYYLKEFLPQPTIKTNREKINPFFHKKPWIHALKGKKVLVVHPFADSIKKQYQNRTKIFPNGFLPDFELHVIPAVQSIGGDCTEFNDWFDALEYMKQEIDKIDYDICLLGCGAYGFPLAAHVKRQGKKGIHLGGVLQLYFGIKGKRWESKGYKNTPNDYSTLFNEYWIRPSISETPLSAKKVENQCYW